jgi:hypothetical protein
VRSCGPSLKKRVWKCYQNVIFLMNLGRIEDLIENATCTLRIVVKWDTATLCKDF